MTTFIWTSFFLGVIGVCVRLAALAALDYPREEEETAGYAVLMTVAGIAWCIWAWAVLH